MVCSNHRYVLINRPDRLTGILHHETKFVNHPYLSPVSDQLEFIDPDKSIIPLPR